MVKAALPRWTSVPRGGLGTASVSPLPLPRGDLEPVAAWWGLPSMCAPPSPVPGIPQGSGQACT